MRNLNVFNHSSVKLAEGFSVISNFAVCTTSATNYSRADFFSSKYLKQNKFLSFI